MRRYHHIGIPTTTPRAGESYLERFGMYVSGYGTSEYGVEWMRFTPDSPVPELVQTVPHVAFEVDDLEAELRGKDILIAPNRTADGTLVAFIVENGAPIEFLSRLPREGSPD
ncbi:MAG: VOC family protein [Gemmatimonadota bacterium]|nr:VOC family protein [Gemmatimonadota bacterium]